MDTPAPAPVKKMGKIRASYLLATESFELFRKDKEIVWYAIWNAVWVLLVGLVFLAGYFLLVMNGVLATPSDTAPTSNGLSLFGYATLFVYYLLCSFITAYYGVALTAVVSTRLEGGDATYKDGITAARSRIKKILEWSILSATVGVVLQVLRDRASWAGRFISFLGGVAWGVATFFIVPVLARENETVAGSVKRSSQVFVSTWGETIIMNFGLGLFFLGIHLALILLAIVAFFLVLSSMGLLGAVILLLAYIVAVIVLIVIRTVLERVFRVVLYTYAVHGTIPDSFTPELIMGALKRKDGQQVVRGPAVAPL